MTDKPTVDVSPEAVAAAVAALEDSRSINGYFSDATLHKFGNMIEALAAALAQAEKERDGLRAGLSTIVHCQSALTRAQMREAAYDILNSKAVYLGGDQSPLVAELSDVKAQRDSALSQMAEARGEIERLRNALERLVHLQAHYAELLNMNDGGRRKQFASAQEWIDRLAQVDAGLPSPLPAD